MSSYLIVWDKSMLWSHSLLGMTLLPLLLPLLKSPLFGGLGDKSLRDTHILLLRVHHTRGYLCGPT